jgi:hypothetical protein
MQSAVKLSKYCIRNTTYSRVRDSNANCFTSKFFQEGFKTYATVFFRSSQKSSEKLSFVSSCLSTLEQLSCDWKVFHDILYCGILLKVVVIVQFSLQWGKNKTLHMKTYVYELSRRSAISRH